MSQAQVGATALFCRLLDLAKPEINGQSLLEGRDKVAAMHLLHERVLVLGKPLDWVTCPECGVETARIVREKSPGEFILHCPECADVVAPGHLRETYKVALQKFVSSLLNGLELSANGMKQIELDLIWRLGTTEKQRGKPVTWYFARRLHQPEIAIRLREQITTERTTQSCVILTSSEVPLPAGSALTEFDVRPLFTVGRVGQSKFEFFPDACHDYQGKGKSQTGAKAEDQGLYEGKSRIGVNERHSQNNAIGDDKGQVDTQLIIKAGSYLPHHRIGCLDEPRHYHYEYQYLEELKMVRGHNEVVSHPAQGRTYHHDRYKGNTHPYCRVHLPGDAHEDTKPQVPGKDEIIDKRGRD